MTHSVSILTFKALINHLIKTSTKNHTSQLPCTLYTYLHLVDSFHLSTDKYLFSNFYIRCKVIWQHDDITLEERVSFFFLACFPMTNHSPVLYCRYKSFSIQMANRVSLFIDDNIHLSTIHGGVGLRNSTGEIFLLKIGSLSADTDEGMCL